MLYTRIDFVLFVLSPLSHTGGSFLAGMKRRLSYDPNPSLPLRPISNPWLSYTRTSESIDSDVEDDARVSNEGGLMGWTDKGQKVHIAGGREN